jgi:uncharacterized damage-inducible protein DinB
MNVKPVITKYVNYNYWANERMTDWLKSLDRSLLHKDIPSSFRSIDLTVQHIIHSQNFWLAVNTGSDISRLDEEIRVNQSDRVMTELMASSQRMIDTYGSYSEGELVTKVTSPDATDSRLEFIIHNVNHGSYHRGQVVTMARGLGVTEGIPTTDYDVYLWILSQKP